MQGVSHSSHDVIEEQLEDRRCAFEDYIDSDVIAVSGPIAEGTHNHLKSAVESVPDRRNRIGVVLETSGGYIEVAERIASILRHHYPVVDFFIPTFAMSAGTVLVMSGDNIYMDYSSQLGPIDPQVDKYGSGNLVPALGYLEQFNRLVEKSNNGTLSTVELAYLIEKFDPAEMYAFEQARDLSIALLEDWLVKFKFRNWTATETQGLPVTEEMKVKRANEIASLLNDTERWHSHSRSITMEVLRRDLKLRIEDIALDPDVKSKLDTYWNLFRNYRAWRRHSMIAVHSQGGYDGHG